MVYQLTIFLLLPLFLAFLPAGKADLAADRAALLRLSTAVGGHTLQWNQSDPTPCSWKGVNCDNATNRVTSLRLPAAGLSGEIRLDTIGSLTQLRNLSLRGNSLSGQLPSDIASCFELRYLFLQRNQFSGEIPSSLFNLSSLVNLNLAGNNFSGGISPGFNNLTQLRTLYLENNQLTGSLPVELRTLSTLKNFNMSFNRLSGSIPSSLARFPSQSFLNNSLCGSPLTSCTNGGNKLSGGAIAGIVIGSVIGFLFILAVLAILWRKSKHSSVRTSLPVKMPSPVQPLQFEISSPENRVFENGFLDPVTGAGKVATVVAAPRVVNVIKKVGDEGLVFLGDGDGGFSLEELLRATAEVLGKGTLGSTYKAYLESGGEVVVKRLRNVCVTEREFSEKVEGLGVLVHDNLVPLRAYYYGKEEKLLVYDCMPLLSLSELLHGNGGAYRSQLTWEIRSRIAVEVATGLKYLHSNNVAHGNIKPSNILLTDQYSACITDFGITQLVSSAVTPNPTGFHAPEMVDSRKISQKADVYSFGVMLLELLTGKAASDAFGDGVDLPRWVESEKWAINVLDTELLKNKDVKDQMFKLLHLGIHCSSEYPERRPPMDVVTRQIKKICGLPPQNGE
ncbi:hypothetical protein RJ640_005824 [Escallonia rubra]|uniref:Protein kinase domain-containing protein n=1 Tax=Escallonia rubra TaxID=112253 RepID=A0AA88RHX1_9ASTE|nr:hypothetical protein RJ640_005824 [Escallonia rubra]